MRIDGKEVATAEAATAAFAKAGTTVCLHAHRPSGGTDAPLDGRASADDGALLKLLHCYLGYCKLTSEAPSTAAIGNSHLLRATTTLNASEVAIGSGASGVRVHAYRFVGISKDEDALLLAEADSAETQEMQFHRLWTAFATEDTVLIAHFWNHYAPIYALRTYRDRASGEKRFELLTAKPAQRPCRWVPWSAMRGYLLQWVGYSIMRFDRLEGRRYF